MFYEILLLLFALCCTVPVVDEAIKSLGVKVIAEVIITSYFMR